jgi:hypothetical protein
MKINGLTVSKPAPSVLVIPFGEQQLVLKIRLVDNHDEFDKIYPEPFAPEIVTGEGARYKDFADAEYLAKKQKRNSCFVDWIYFHALDATEGLEWSKVKENDPETWHFWREELVETGMPATYVGRIISKINEVNGFNTELIDKATEAFLASTLEKPRI